MTMRASRIGVFVAVIVACFVLSISSQSKAHPWSAQNSGYGAFLAHPGSNPTNVAVTRTVDGFYYRTTIEPLDVPFLSGGSHTAGVISPCGISNSCVNGANARPQQIVSQYPTPSRDAGEFLANGYAAGCTTTAGVKQCTGVHSNGGVYKRWYQDGRICDPWYNCGYMFTANQLSAVSSNTSVEFQVQRNGGAPGGGYHWRGWYRKSGEAWQVSELHRNGHRPQMWYGLVAIGAENLNLSGAMADGALPLHQRQIDWRSMRHHHYGQPGTAPPGIHNYTNTETFIPTSPHSPACYATVLGATTVEGRGRC